MTKITQEFYQTKRKITVKRFFLLFALLLIGAQMSLGQNRQIIGSYPVMDGGLEGQTATTAIGAVTAGVTSTVWTLDSNSNTTVRSIINNPANARTGNMYISHTTTSTKYLQTPTATGITASKKYIVQYWVNSPATTESFGSLTKEMRQSELVQMKNRQSAFRSEAPLSLLN
jgi:hypothetical protein